MMQPSKTSSIQESEKQVHQSETLLSAIPVLKSSCSDLDLKDDCKAESSSFWEFFLYVPILLQSLFGTLYLVRSLFIGHAVSRILQRFEEWTGPNAWPPPSFVFLASLTVLALIVHPDGLTWILLRHFRQGIMSFVEAACSCWQIVLNEHGAIISTGLALSTFAGLFFFVFVLHKTLSPRQQQNLPSTKPQPQRPKSTSSSKKKKRKSGNGRSRTGKVRTEAQLPGKKDCNDDLQVEHSKESTSEENVQEGLPRSNRDSSLPAEEPKREIPEEDVVLTSQTPSSPLVRSRDRTLSNSTAETLATSASGDQSYKSTSGRTTPTLPSGSPNEPEHKVKSTHRNTPRSTPRKSNNRRRGAGKKTDSRNSNNNKQPSTSLPAASRWDALKPTNRNDHRQGHVLQSPPRVSSSARSRNRPVPSPEETSVSSSSSVAATDAPMIPLTRNVPGLDAGLIAPSPIESLLPVKGSPVYSQSPSHYSLPRSPQNPMLSNLRDPMTSGLGCRTQQYDSSSLSVLNNTPSKNPANRPNWMGSTVRAPPGFSEPVSCQTSHSPMVAPSSSVQPPIFTDYTFRQEPRVKMNPFASDEEDQLVGRQSCEPYLGAKHNDVDQIEAELEELGGRMVGSILDF